MQYTWGRHTIKGGIEWSKNENFRNTTFLGGETETSLQAGLAGLTAAALATGSFSAIDFNVNNTSDFGGLINTINGLPNRAAFYSAFDTNSDGTITSAEMGPLLTFNTIRASDGTVQYDRTFQSAVGPQLTSSKGLSFFVQDQFQFNRLTINAGLRAERWEHFATTGREHLHVRLGVRAASERRVRPARRRPAEGLRVLRPLLRSDPQQHDQLRGHA